MKDRLRTMRARRAGGDRGFTLIELLVVVVIIGVLVAIAIPVYISYRSGALKKSAASDTRNAVTAIEQCFTDNGDDYPASVTGTAGAAVTLTCGLGTMRVNVSTGNILTYTRLTTTTFTVAVENVSTGVTYTYTSSTGATAES